MNVYKTKRAVCIEWKESGGGGGGGGGAWTSYQTFTSLLYAPYLSFSIVYMTHKSESVGRKHY